MGKSSTTFFNGWRSLPDELKLQILEHALPAKYTYCEYHFRRWDHSGFYEDANFNRLYLLLSIPELKEMVLEAFYSQNTILIEQGNIYGPTTWPPNEVRSHVRRLRIDIRTSKLPMLDLLNKIANGLGGFGNLHHLKLRLNGGMVEYQHGAIIDAIENMDPITFPARVLEVRYLHDICSKWIDGYGDGTECDPTEMLWLSKFTIHGGQEKVKVQLERYYQQWGRGPKQFVKEWPVITRALRTRYTKKITSI